MIALIDEYRKELTSVACFAEDTIENYVSCILSFIEYCRNHLKIEPAKCRGHHILGWITEIKKTGVSNSRLQHHRSALKELLCLFVQNQDNQEKSSRYNTHHP